MGENVYGQSPPHWQFRNEGKEIFQELNSAPGIAIGNAKLSSVDFEGTLYVATNRDYDYIGAIFAFQVQIILKNFLKKIFENLCFRTVPIFTS